MKKVAFFFGAGAEAKGNYGIPTGPEYLKKVLFDSSVPEKLKSLSDVFSGENYYGGSLKYSKHTIDITDVLLKKMIIQKASNKEETFFKLFDGIVRSFVNKDEIKQICEELEIEKYIENYQLVSHSKYLKDIRKQIRDEFKEILAGRIKRFCQIKNKFLRCLLIEGDDGSISYDLNVGIAGYLDSYFHTIIDPTKYGKINFFKIFNYYWSCYFAIVEEVLKFLENRKIEGIERYIVNGEIEYKTILENIGEFTKYLYTIKGEDVVSGESYYQIICDKLSGHKDIECVGTITTNYYKFCEVVSQNKVIYLNGQLKYFEYPELLEVRDMEKEENSDNKLFFPFIFGQSLVKPIVNKLQTEAFYEFQELLLGNKDNSAEVLVVLGFNINEDDNHINAFLHNFVEQGKELIIVTDDENYDVQRKLRCSPEKVKICKVEYGDNRLVVDRIFETIIEKIS